MEKANEDETGSVEGINYSGAGEHDDVWWNECANHTPQDRRDL